MAISDILGGLPRLNKIFKQHQQKQKNEKCEEGQAEGQVLLQQQQQQLTDASPGKKENQTKAQAGEKESSDNKVASPSKAVIESPDDKKAKALMSLAAGKRHMLVRDIPAAVSSLGKACKLLSAECGETSPECAEAYFHYGRALLEMDRLEAGVLDNVDANDESEDHNDDDDEESPAEGKEEPAKPEAKKGDETEKDKCTSEQQQRTDQQQKIPVTQQQQQHQLPHQQQKQTQLQQSLQQQHQLQQQQQLTDAAPGKKENQTKAQAGEEENSDNKVASPSKAVTESPEDKKAKTLMPMAAGKRHMLLRDITAALKELKLHLIGLPSQKQLQQQIQQEINIAETLYQIGKAIRQHLEYQKLLHLHQHTTPQLQQRYLQQLNKLETSLLESYKKRSKGRQQQQQIFEQYTLNDKHRWLWAEEKRPHIKNDIVFAEELQEQLENLP